MGSTSGQRKSSRAPHEHDVPQLKSLTGGELAGGQVLNPLQGCVTAG
jgi:hypothetical protein